VDWLEKVFKFLREAALREFTTDAGRANVIFVVLLTVGIFAFGYIDVLKSIITSIWGEDSADFPPFWALAGDLLLMVFCVSILFAGERK
jgi:hypothetical protein